MRESVRHVEEERLILVRPDELLGLLRVTLRQLGLVGARLKEFTAAVEGGVPPLGILIDARTGHLRLRLVGRVHIVRVHQTEMEIEAVGERMMLGLVIGPDAEVPFADQSGGVAGVLQRLGQGHFGGGQAAGGDGAEDAELIVGHAGADGVASGHESGAARGADLGGGIELREAQAFGGHTIQIRRLDRRVAVAAEVAVAEVVGQDDDDVRLRGGVGADGERDEQGQQQGLHKDDKGVRLALGKGVLRPGRGYGLKGQNNQGI